MNKLQLLTDRICELVPVIKELKTGCRAKIGDTVYHVEEWVAPSETFIVKRHAEMNAPKYTRAEKIDKIIGRDITLADVLLAYDKAVGYGPWNDEVTLSTVFKWNLTKNALHEQDEETVDWLYSIICK